MEKNDSLQYPHSPKVPQHSAQYDTSAKTTEQVQPWQKYVDEINELNQHDPLDKDFFKCCEGFNDHSLAG